MILISYGMWLFSALKSCSRKIIKRMAPRGVLDIYRAYRDRVLPGFALYEEVVRRYGDDVRIGGTAWRGTGNYLFVGMYLKAWLKKNNVANYVFMMPGAGLLERIFEDCFNH